MSPPTHSLRYATYSTCERARRHILLLSVAGFVLFGSLAAYQHSPSQPPKEIFTDVTEQARISWHHFSGESPDRFLIETMGGGVAFLDFDGDGFQDLFFVNGGETPRGKSSFPVRNALYRNIGNGEFEDVSAKAALRTSPSHQTVQ